jgi:pseudoazurin
MLLQENITAKDLSMKMSFMAFTLLAAFSAQAKNVDITMKNNGKDGLMTFEPGFVQVQVGDTLTFIPGDKTHNSTSIVIPSGAKGWAGKMDEKIVVKLDTEGVYIFKCDPHTPMGMAGVAQVGKPTNLEAAKKEAEKMSKNFAMNKDRLAKYLAQVK